MARPPGVRSDREEVSGPGGGVGPDRMPMTTDYAFPRCLKCDAGVLLPLSDYGRDGAPIQYKAWVCNNPGCGFNIRIDNGEISLGRAIAPKEK